MQGRHECRLRASALAEALGRIARHFGRYIIVTSGYRTPSHNAATPGADPDSYHVYGLAADIVIPGVPPEQVAAYARHVLGMGGVALYRSSGFVHVDVGAWRGNWQDPFPSTYDVDDAPAPPVIPADVPVAVVVAGAVGLALLGYALFSPPPNPTLP